MTTDEVFAAFGGREQVEAITGARRNAVNHWRTEGIPFRHWAALIEEAERNGIPGITLQALGSTRPVREERTAPTSADRRQVSAA